MEAAYSLGKIGDRDAVLALCEALDVEWTGMWYAATWALRLLGDSSAVFALCNLLRSTSGEDRVHVAEALTDIGGPTAIEALCGVLGDSNTETAAAAAEGLGRIGGPTVVKALCDFLEGRDAQSSINEIGLNGLCHKHVATDTCPREAEELVKCACVKALGDIGSVRAFPVLKRVLLDDSNPTTLRSEAAGALGDLDLPGVVPPLLKVLEDKDSSLVSSVAWRLGMLKAQGAILPICRAAITRMDMDLEWIAIALCHFPKDRVAKAVELVVNVGDPAVASDLADALMWLGGDPPAPIDRLLLSPDSQVKAWASRAMDFWK
jgi:HEAT repeat protein